MQTLMLVRHAKSSWKQTGMSDRERPLAARGRRDAPRMGRRLARHGWRPKLILCSPALRALETARLLAKRLDYRRRDIVVEPRLYATTAEHLLEVIGELPDTPRRVMIVAHNPELERLAHRFDAGVLALPTCAVVALRFDVAHWRDIVGAKPESTWYSQPRKRAKADLS